MGVQSPSTLATHATLIVSEGFNGLYDDSILRLHVEEAGDNEHAG